MAKLIAEAIGKKIRISVLAGVGVSILRLFFSSANKAFGTLISKDTEDFDYCYCTVDFEESVKKSV
jgi:xanthine/uracil/vitamin C permease (AzgA family)